MTNPKAQLRSGVRQNPAPFRQRSVQMPLERARLHVVKMGLAPSLIVCFLLGAATSAWAQGYAAPPDTSSPLQQECPADLSRSTAGTLSFSGTGQAFGTPDEAEVGRSGSSGRAQKLATQLVLRE